ncbi:MAG: type III-B CRISPR module RAMP protein Cmr6 [Magnetococcus sp. YQC-9]
MNAPLYQNAFIEARRQFNLRSTSQAGMLRLCSHAGLWFDKFCNRWKPDFKQLVSDDAKRDWMRTVTNVLTRDDKPGDPISIGDGTLLQEHEARRRSLVGARRGQVLNFTFETRFATGLGRSHPAENGCAWHPVLGVPYLSGSGVKGLVRAWAREWAGASTEDLARIFGPEPLATQLSVGSVIFLDALPNNPVRLVVEVMTPHYGPWYQQSPAAVPADWHSPIPIPFLAVEVGTSFSFALMPRSERERDCDDCQQTVEWLKEALPWMGAGAKSSSGMGRGELLSQFARVAVPPHPANVQPHHLGRPVEILGEEDEGHIPVRYLDGGGEEEYVPAHELH